MLVRGAWASCDGLHLLLINEKPLISLRLQEALMKLKETEGHENLKNGWLRMQEQKPWKRVLLFLIFWELTAILCSMFLIKVVYASTVWNVSSVTATRIFRVSNNNLPHQVTIRVCEVGLFFGGVLVEIFGHIRTKL